jgi:hypothetical protein
MAWLSGYSYRKSITLSRASGAVTNYQMKLLVGESSGASGEDVDCNSHCATDFDDLRFTTSDETTLLDYWIESVSGTTPNQLATVWIEFNSIGTGATTFYMYYGNSSASAGSNGDNTFNFFEHFLDDPPASADWFHWFDHGSETVSGSIFSVTGHSSYNGWGCKQKFGTNYAYRGRFSVNTDGTATDSNIFGFDDRSDDGTCVGTGSDLAGFYLGAELGKIYLTGREGKQTQAARTDALTSYSIVEIQRNSTTNVKFLINDSLKQTTTTNVPTDTCGFVLYSNNASVTINWDWCLVRQYLATEPAWGSWGDETAGGATVKPYYYYLQQ